jgi:hypothetical protein
MAKKRKRNKRGKGDYSLRKKTPEASLWSIRLIPSGDTSVYIVIFPRE